MAVVSGILCQIMTGNENGAGTNGKVYLGFGGREFRMDTHFDDYERGSYRTYIIGRGPDYPDLSPSQKYVDNSSWNNPEDDFVILTENLGKAPVYIRFEPKNSRDAWNIRDASVSVFIHTSEFVVGYTPPTGFDNLWMGDEAGKALYLTREWRVGGPMMRYLSERHPALREHFKLGTRPAAKTRRTSKRRPR